MKAFPAAAIALLFASSLLAREHRVEVLKEAAPADDLSKEIAGQLNDGGFRIARGTSTTVCDVWLCKEWAVPADFKPNEEILYPFKPGQLVGVVRYARKGGDFRDQDIAKGVYTLRYAQQPIDGNHVGTSPTRDFFLLVSADVDKSVKLDMEKLIEASAEAAASTHPAMLCLQRVAGKAKKQPVIRHNDTHDWWIVSFTGKAKAGEKVKDLPIDLVIVGFAAE